MHFERKYNESAESPFIAIYVRPSALQQTTNDLKSFARWDFDKPFSDNKNGFNGNV